MAQSQIIPSKQMTVTQFLEWVEKHPNGRYELVRGEIIAMAPERARHALTKDQATQALKASVHQAGVDCTVFPDGMTVVVDEHTSYEPDVTVQCSGDIDLDSVLVREPIIVVEVLSPSTGYLDIAGKLVDYFRVESIEHYLIVDTKRRTLIHHQRKGEDILTHLLTGGNLMLDSPGLEISISDFFIKEPFSKEEV